MQNINIHMKRHLYLYNETYKRDPQKRLLYERLHWLNQKRPTKHIQIYENKPTYETKLLLMHSDLPKRPAKETWKRNSNLYVFQCFCCEHVTPLVNFKYLKYAAEQNRPKNETYDRYLYIWMCFCVFVGNMWHTRISKMWNVKWNKRDPPKVVNVQNVRRKTEQKKPTKETHKRDLQHRFAFECVPVSLWGTSDHSWISKMWKMRWCFLQVTGIDPVLVFTLCVPRGSRDTKALCELQNHTRAREKPTHKHTHTHIESRTHKSAQARTIYMPNPPPAPLPRTNTHTHAHTHTPYTYSHTHIHTHKDKHKHANSFTHAHTYIETHTNTPTHTDTRRHTHAGTHIHTHTHTHL